MHHYIATAQLKRVVTHCSTTPRNLFSLQRLSPRLWPWRSFTRGASVTSNMNEEEKEEEEEEEEVQEAEHPKKKKKKKAQKDAQRRPKKQHQKTEAEWLSPVEYKKQRVVARLVELHDRMLEGQLADTKELSLLTHLRCIAVSDSEDGVLQYIWDLAKVGHSLGMLKPNALGVLMGRFAAHNRMELAQEVYAHIIALQEQTGNSTSKLPQIRQKDMEHLIIGLAKKGEVDHALSFLRQLSKGASDPWGQIITKRKQHIGAKTFSTVIRAVSRNNCQNDVHGLIEEIEKSLPVCLESYNSMMMARNTVGDPERALQILDQILASSRLQPDVWTYVEAVESCLQLGAMDRAFSLLDLIVEKMKEGPPVSSAEHEESKQKEKEEERACAANHKGIQQEEEEGHREREDKIHPADGPQMLQTWNRILSRFADNGRHKEIFVVWHKMREICLPPNNETAFHLIRACVQKKDMARAHSVIVNMLNHHNLKVDHRCWKEILEGYARDGQLVALWKNLKKIEKNGIHINDEIWRLVEHAFREQDVWPIWEPKLKRMKKRVCPTEVKRQPLGRTH